MSKLIKIILSLLALIIITIIAGIFFLNPIVSKLKPQIEKSISSIAKQDVKISNIEAKVFPNIGIKLSRVELENNVASIDNLFLHTGLNQLLKGKLNVDTFSLSDAKFKLSKNKDGLISLGKYILNKKNKETKKAINKKTEDKPNTKNDEQVKFNLKDIKISSLNIDFKDTSKSPSAEYKLENLNLTASDIGNSKKGNFTLDGKVLNAELSAKGKINLENTIEIDSLNVKAGGQSLNINSIINQKPSISAKTKLNASNFNIEKFLNILAPNIAGKTSGIVLGNLNVDSGYTDNNVNTDLKLDKLNLKGTDLLKNINLHSKVKLNKNGNTITIDKSNFEMFSGKVDINSKIVNQAKTSANISASNMDLSLISNFIMPNSSVKLEGQLDKLDIKSNLNLKKPKKTINSNIKALATNGTIKGLNILAKTLEELKGIPGIDSAISKYVPEKYSNILNSENTSFSQLDLKSSLIGEKINIKSFNLAHSLYTISGNGNILTSGKLELNTKLIISNALSQEIIAKNKNLKYLSEKDGTIIIPVIIKKNGKTPIVLPDVKNLVKRAAKSGGEELVEKAINKGIEKGLKKIAPGLNFQLKNLF